MMFEKGEIWAYPTDTSFGLGVRSDDLEGLKNLQVLKQRSGEKYFSLMVRDWEMLNEFANLSGVDVDESFFIDQPRTAILKPSKNLPQTPFWPSDKVAFRVCTLPEIAEKINYPVTATSANLSGSSAIYTVEGLETQFSDQIQVYDKIPSLPMIPASEIWDFTAPEPIQIR